MRRRGTGQKPVRAKPEDQESETEIGKATSPSRRGFLRCGPARSHPSSRANTPSKKTWSQRRFVARAEPINPRDEEAGLSEIRIQLRSQPRHRRPRMRQLNNLTSA